VRLTVALFLSPIPPIQESASVPAQLKQSAIAHIRFDGKSLDVPLIELGVIDPGSEPEIRRAVARHLEVSEERLRDHVLDRHETGNVTLRPQAVFG
jgi:hypothetical protein